MAQDREGVTLLDLLEWSVGAVGLVYLAYAVHIRVLDMSTGSIGSTTQSDAVHQPRYTLTLHRVTSCE